MSGRDGAGVRVTLAPGERVLSGKAIKAMAGTAATP